MEMMSSTQCGHTWQQHIKFPTLCPVPNVKKLMDSLLKKTEGAYPKVLEGKTTKKFGCDFVGCGKRYTTQVALDTHKAEAHNPNKIVSEPELQYTCEHCAKTLQQKVA